MRPSVLNTFLLKLNLVSMAAPHLSAVGAGFALHDVPDGCRNDSIESKNHHSQWSCSGIEPNLKPLEVFLDLGLAGHGPLCFLVPIFDGRRVLDHRKHGAARNVYGLEHIARKPRPLQHPPACVGFVAVDEHQIREQGSDIFCSRTPNSRFLACELLVTSSIDIPKNNPIPNMLVQPRIKLGHCHPGAAAAGCTMRSRGCQFDGPVSGLEDCLVPASGTPNHAFQNLRKLHVATRNKT